MIRLPCYTNQYIKNEKGSPKSHVTTFLVAPNGAVDIILGAEFLFREKIFTYNEAILTLQDTDLTAEGNFRFVCGHHFQSLSLCFRENAKVQKS